MKNGKRILSVTVKQVLDSDPDTSYLGVYSNRATSYFSIDRAHSLDCVLNSHANDAVIDQLDRVIDYLTTKSNKLQSDQPLEPLSTLETWESIEEAQDILIEKQDELKECTCDDSGDMARNEYRYFNPSFNYVKSDGTLQDGNTADEVRQYVRQDYDRMESYNASNWHYIGIQAEAEIQLGKNQPIQTLSSGGLYGIESDSDKDYIASVHQEELSGLRSVLKSAGFSSRAISQAFKTVCNSHD